MPTIRRRSRFIRREKPLKPEVITGNFELHYEDVVNRNRYALVALFATGLILAAAFIPRVVNRSLARPDHVSLEAENGTVFNQEQVRIVGGDITASQSSYIEFKLKAEE